MPLSGRYVVNSKASTCLSHFVSYQPQPALAQVSPFVCTALTLIQNVQRLYPGHRRHLCFQAGITQGIGAANDTIAMQKPKRLLRTNLRLKCNGQNIERSSPALTSYLGPIARNNDQLQLSHIGHCKHFHLMCSSIRRAQTATIC